ncbi:RHS repeat-associated core domain-containing protein [Bacillus sp. 3255]|uniref:RHS repeat-associated core domain-containing protein n=1 Tax=Bacillus sp. 3255 TaxID=2817904 RepID=UPI002861B86A|nr:RHS repeat-associated core domain-containing protein [Bacillus sp. 3255]MDR6882436.1 RHS repeat-associated protein [Bacillus sp. 3255]
MTYLYNGDGILYERTENGVTTRYYYDGGNLIAEGTVSSNGAATLKARYEYGNGLNARIDTNGNKQFYQFNGHGDVIGLTDSNGTTLNSYSYDIWGNPIIAQETVQQPFRYSGEFYDSSTGLQYLKARWYDPSVGRFINEDTYEGQIDNPLSLNLYTYVENNPLTKTDPTGHCSCTSKSLTNPRNPLSYGAISASYDPYSYGDPYYDIKSLISPDLQTEQWKLDEQEMIIFQQQAQEEANSSVIQQPIIDNSAYILTSSNSALLRSNLKGAGYSEPTYSNAAHHIVAAIDGRAKIAQDILNKYNVDIDSAYNGVFLPTSDGFVESNHRRIHTNVYYDNVNSLLSGAKSQDDVIDILDDIRDQLTNGTFPIN